VTLKELNSYLHGGSERPKPTFCEKLSTDLPSRVIVAIDAHQLLRQVMEVGKGSIPRVGSAGAVGSPARSQSWCSRRSVPNSLISGH
jgi:hypothetical protein